MDLWSEPMNPRTMVLFAIGAAVWLFLIVREIRDHARNRRRRPVSPHEDLDPTIDARLDGELPPARVLARAAFLLVLLALPFLIVGVVFGAAGAALALTLLLATIVWSLWQAGPFILERCGARAVADPHLVEEVAELAARAGIPSPHLLETQEQHPNAFALGTSRTRTAIILTRGLRLRLTHAELHAVIAHEIARIAQRDTAKAVIGATILRPLAALALRLGLVGPSGYGQGAPALLFFLALTPLSALVLRYSSAPARAYRVDRAAAALCGNPDDLIAALTKLETATRRFASITANDQPAVAVLCIIDPLPNSWVGRLFTAQPRTARRIARLRALGRSAAGAPFALAAAAE
jgi:heat shock protein HtpX